MTLKGILFLSLGFLLISASLIMGDSDIPTVILLWIGMVLAWFGHAIATADEDDIEMDDEFDE